MMKQIFGIILYFISVIPLFAATTNQGCNELWFARNAMLDRGGYCFSSPLGQSVFNNENCSTQNPMVGKPAQAMIEAIRKQERHLGCTIDTKKTDTGPFLQFMSDRMQLDVQPPTPENLQSRYSCIGYSGDQIPLYAAPDPSSQVLDTIRNGSDIAFNHQFMLHKTTYEILQPMKNLNDPHWQFIVLFSQGQAIGKKGWILASPLDFGATVSNGGSCSFVSG